jgi:hypothetical protein
MPSSREASTTATLKCLQQEWQGQGERLYRTRDVMQHTPAALHILVVFGAFRPASRLSTRAMIVHLGDEVGARRESERCLSVRSRDEIESPNLKQAVVGGVLM